MPTGRPRHSFWEVCETIEAQFKGFFHVPPLNTDPFNVRELFVKEIGTHIWSAQEQYARKSPRAQPDHHGVPAFFLSGCPLPEESGLRRSLRCLRQVRLKLLELNHFLHILMFYFVFFYLSIQQIYRQFLLSYNKLCPKETNCTNH